MSVASVKPAETQRGSKLRGAPKRDSRLAAQINVRMDAALKARAEEAFANAGLSSSDVVRSAYLRAAELGSELTCMSDIVRTPHIEDEELVRTNSMCVFERATHSVERAFESLGLKYDPSQSTVLTEEEIERHYFEDYIKGNL